MLLRAESTVELVEPADVLRKLCDRYIEHATVDYGRDMARIVVSFGEAHLEATPTSLKMVAQAPDETGLAYVKMGISTHLRMVATQSSPDIRWAGDGAVGVLPPFFRVMRVVTSRSITPHMQRVTLAGEDLARYATGGLHMRLVFPPQGRTPVWPHMGEDGCPVWPQGEDQLVLRVYTLRSVDAQAGTVDVDMVLHPGSETPGAYFAQTARTGDLVGMSGPGGGSFPQAQRIILAGDETALPAIARIVENAAPDAAVTAFIEVDGAADEQQIFCRGQLDLRWLHRNGAAAGTTGMLAAAVKDFTAGGLPEDSFVWVGCEFEDFRAIRSYLRKELKLDRSRHMAVAYWRRGIAGDEARRGSRDAE
ncbi:siderophore-interacting protein [Aureimonas fodinaquatilis]|uniref:Siderophore-interacting protein n=1 Tax=Aureimonas fodinaquatilis TaxID=2565783 RepID=A0A5B0E0E1_9HYPH|nr:siderophore-interacting protein [Aureimonas fodinaquatilis]KAA0972098.1 siderophore-interacting protein [Aureimonas fodinaquatilis]